MNITRRMVGGTDLTQSLDPLGPRTVEAVETMSPVPPRWRRGMLVALLAAAGGLAAAQLALGQADLPVAWLAAVPLVASVTLSIKATSAAAAEALALAALVQFRDTGSRGDRMGSAVGVVSVVRVRRCQRTLAGTSRRAPGTGAGGSPSRPSRDPA